MKAFRVHGVMVIKGHINAESTEDLYRDLGLIVEGINQTIMQDGVHVELLDTMHKVNGLVKAMGDR